MTTTLTIEGDRITGIPSFYDEINRVFMHKEDWRLGESLDALNDLLHGGYGAIAGSEPVTLVWRGFETSRAALGVEVTRAFYRNKLRQPERYDAERITSALAELEAGTGPTYFEIVLSIIADHPNITLIPR